MDEVEQKLKKMALEYYSVMSNIVPSCGGKVIAIKNYYPDNKESISLSIALSYDSNAFLPKCWLSTKIEPNGENKPLYYPTYEEFTYKGIHYYPYSIKTSDYKLIDVINLCDGLYRYVKENA